MTYYTSFICFTRLLLKSILFPNTAFYCIAENDAIGILNEHDELFRHLWNNRTKISNTTSVKSGRRRIHNKRYTFNSL